MIYLFTSPFGGISYDWNGYDCRHVDLNPSPRQSHEQQWVSSNDPVSAWLTAYFRGQIKALPALHPANTPFQQRMREALIKITWGETCTYGDIATLLNTAPRAIGQALKANPLPLLIPCHRVLAANGLGGFNGGHTWKVNLLKFERRLTQPPNGGLERSGGGV